MNNRSGKSYRIGVIGFAHMHVNALVDQFIATGRAEIVACADTQPRTPSMTTVEGSRQANLKRTLAAPSAPRLYRDYHEMLKAEQLDVAILCPENAQHAEVAEAVAGGCVAHDLGRGESRGFTGGELADHMAAVDTPRQRAA
jgi:predicted dehydrogenase